MKISYVILVSVVIVGVYFIFFNKKDTSAADHLTDISTKLSSLASTMVSNGNMNIQNLVPTRAPTYSGGLGSPFHF